MKRGLLAGLLAALLVSSLVAAPAAASPDLNFEQENTPNPALTADSVTIGQYNMSAMDSPLEYYDDSGNVAELNATYNTSQDNPFTYRADQVNAAIYSEFPRESADASAIDHSEWTTTSGASSSVSVNDADGNTAQGVPAVEIAATVADTETATATYSNFSTISTDANKRVLRFVGNVDTLATGAQVEVRAVDSDGDYKAATINSSATASNDGVIGTGTGQGYVFQQRLSELATVGTNGDGSFDDIAKIEVVTSDADATVTIVGLDAESKSAMTLGETVNADGDEVVVEERNAGGDMSVDIIGLDTLGSSFDEATLNNFRVSDVRYPLSEVVAEEDYNVEFSDATDYAYDRKLELDARLDIPAAIDLTHSGLAFEMDQTFVSQRYAIVEMAEGVGTTEFENISSWEDKTDLFSSEGATVTLDDTVAVDKQYAVSATILLQQGEEDAMTSSMAGGPVGAGSGGLIGSIFAFFDSLVGKAVGVVVGFVGAVKGFGRMMGS
jgi:hypothetical protein